MCTYTCVWQNDICNVYRRLLIFSKKYLDLTSTNFSQIYDVYLVSYIYDKNDIFNVIFTTFSKKKKKKKGQYKEG